MSCNFKIPVLDEPFFRLIVKAKFLLLAGMGGGTWNDYFVKCFSSVFDFLIIEFTFFMKERICLRKIQLSLLLSRKIN